MGIWSHRRANSGCSWLRRQGKLHSSLGVARSPVSTTMTNTQATNRGRECLRRHDPGALKGQPTGPRDRARPPCLRYCWMSRPCRRTETDRHHLFRVPGSSGVARQIGGWGWCRKAPAFVDSSLMEGVTVAWTCQTAQATRAESTAAHTGRGRPHRFDLETFHGAVPWNRSRRSIRGSNSPASNQSYCWDWLVEPTLKATTAAVLSARHGSNRRSGKSVDFAPNG
jgi:hypothetical protein